MAGADVLAVTAGNALAEVNMREIILNGNRSGRAFSGAFSAADAARLAHLHNLRALVLVAAGDDNVLLLGDHSDDALGAGIGAGAAADTFIAVDLGNAVDYFHRAELAGFHAVAHAYAGVGAELVALPAEQHRRAAILRTGIVEALFGNAFTAGATDKRNLLLDRVGFYAHNLGYLLRRFFATGNTFVCRSFACGHSGGITVTSGITAAAAVGARETRANRFLFGIDFYMENFGCETEKSAEKAAETTENEDRPKNFNHFFLLPLRKSSCR